MSNKQKKSAQTPADAAILRQKAEEQLKLRSDKARLVSTTEADKLKLVHELEVHQIELEMQNEELLIAKESAEIAKEKYTELYDFAPSGYLSLTKEGNIAELNFAAARMFGKERSKLINSRFAIFLSVNTRPVFNQFFQRIFTAKEKQSCEVIIEAKDNLPIYVTIDGIVSQNSELCLLTLNDITESKIAKNALVKAKEKAEESKENFRSLSENSLDYIMRYDKDFRHIYMNKNAIEASGGTAEQIIGKTHSEAGLYDIAQCEMWEQKIECVFKTKQPYFEQFSWESVNGNIYLDWRLFPEFNDKGEVVSVLGVSRDITYLKNAEIELISAKEIAEESDRLKSAFLANMSHEIRTPMNGILGFADLLKNPKITGDEQQTYISIIEKSGARMLNIINDIVDISKIEAGLMKLDIKETNVNEQIEYIYTFFKPEAETKGIKLTFKNPLPAKEAAIKTDREKLYAILTNLVKNAIKYTNEGTIEFGYKLKKNNAATELEFCVKDTGIGIPQNRQEAIFERFIQADIEDKQAHQGAGLGLGISKAYVEMLGGKIWVESQANNLPAAKAGGSTFYFTLPYNTEPTKESNGHQAVVSEKNETVRKLKILIAEDDEVSEILLDATIKMFGKEILKTKTGVEAVEICRKNPDIDLILMDVRMPEMSGYQATMQIREFNKEIIIIAQTAYGLTGDREKAIESGCNDYIAKPIKTTELQAMIQKYFAK
ncbi:PAS domain-containing hybrid sensor histidine kinase/response regulator [Lentimicrobium sp. S6]|uniref:PAS domain-containing hybrid sensor histidine kinase/response regulator n=1 Tax=Lentimicrobium sp. S6 TaxID=2735872 RepID=UPI001553F3A0|nr:PAS domain-containing hybrid sensor histidine kinase/response regulator [Lentimicrobium sp. S6]NPD47976.1 response regulator [Lentimicrobium sp. S6]